MVKMADRSGTRSRGALSQPPPAEHKDKTPDIPPAMDWRKDLLALPARFLRDMQINAKTGIIEDYAAKATGARMFIELLFSRKREDYETRALKDRIRAQLVRVRTYTELIRGQYREDIYEWIEKNPDESRRKINPEDGVELLLAPENVAGLDQATQRIRALASVQEPRFELILEDMLEVERLVYGENLEKSLSVSARIKDQLRVQATEEKDK